MSTILDNLTESLRGILDQIKEEANKTKNEAKNNMIKELQIVESASIKMLGESFKMSNVISDDELSNRHKNVVNELAVVIAGRNRFGFR